MSFLVLLIVLWVEKFSAWRQRFQRDGFFLGELRRLEAHRRLGRQPAVLLLILVVLPAVLLGLLLLVLKPVAYGLLALPVHLLVVLYSLGRGDIKASLGPLRDAWRRGDEEAAVLVAERDLGLEAETPQALLEAVENQLLWHAYQSFFAVVFWYFLLGPVAALSYRLLALIAEHGRSPTLVERAEQLRHAFDFLPVRVLASSFALVGNFMAVSRVMLQELLNWHLSAWTLIGRAGRVAGELAAPQVGAQGVQSLASLWELLLRSAVLWYAAFALWTLLY
jgi:AmpE protein